jgi:hypothetical protein
MGAVIVPMVPLANKVDLLNFSFLYLALICFSFGKGAQQLISYIQDTRSTLAQMGLGGKVPVGNSDAGAYFNTQVLEAVDYGVRVFFSFGVLAFF